MNSLSFINKPFYIIKTFSLYNNKNKLQLSLYNNNKINENIKFELSKKIDRIRRINRFSIYLILLLLLRCMYIYF